MCSFLKGRSFPGTIKLSRKDKPPAANSQAGSNDSADIAEAFSKSRSPSSESLGVSTSSHVRARVPDHFCWASLWVYKLQIAQTHSCVSRHACYFTCIIESCILLQVQTGCSLDMQHEFATCQDSMMIISCACQSKQNPSKYLFTLDLGRQDALMVFCPL